MRNQKELTHNSTWNTLIVLDACRFDYFQEIAEEENYGFTIEPVWSEGCATGEWYKNTWHHDKYEDTILVSETPVPWHWSGGLFQSKFHKSFPLWKELKLTLNTFHELGEILQKAQRIHKEYPDKRMLLHLIPPHLPYFHEEGMKFLIDRFGKETLHNGTIYTRVQNHGNEYGWKKLIEYYKQNIKAVVDELLQHTWEENTVITSDHGELIGEGGFYGHEEHNPTDTALLRTVPWVIL